MDLNQLYSDHQILLVRAAQAPTVGVRQHHALEASRIARRIHCMQRAAGAAAALAWEKQACSEQAAT